MGRMVYIKQQQHQHAELRNASNLPLLSATATATILQSTALPTTTTTLIRIQLQLQLLSLLLLPHRHRHFLLYPSLHHREILRLIRRVKLRQQRPLHCNDDIDRSCITTTANSGMDDIDDDYLTKTTITKEASTNGHMMNPYIFNVSNFLLYDVQSIPFMSSIFYISSTRFFSS